MSIIFLNKNIKKNPTSIVNIFQISEEILLKKCVLYRGKKTHFSTIIILAVHLKLAKLRLQPACIWPLVHEWRQQGTYSQASEMLKPQYELIL